MLGNCATGKLRMVRVPTITRTIETTMATMGRLMKNFDIGLLPLVFPVVGLGIDGRSLPRFLHALDDDAIAGLESVVNHPSITDAVADLHGSDVHFVVSIYGGDLI